ncbi:jerky protein homolog-like [Hylaeus anthracinus]|uniref:jerky protein homolog-like n=1 Tax=Hylaeus anthracinus TaxID=313031 RepID=UPI0023BA30ED|nr:jerky protein homolog-like [Hylaeus anthracinus]
MASKRKRVVLSIKTKHEIIQKLENGESAAKLAKTYGIGKATITGIKNQKCAIENYLLQADSLDASTSRKSLMVPKNKNVDDAVFQWFLQNRDKGVPISGPILCEKALEFNKKLEGNPNFKASSGWLEKFKSRHGIRELNVLGEKLSTSNVAAESLTADLHKFLIEKGCALQNVCNVNESSLSCTALPQKTLASCHERSPPNCKISKDHVTTLLCANTTGCPVLIIGKIKKFI